MIKRETLNTEKQNHKTVAIDQISTSEALKTINDEDQKVSIAVRKALPEIERFLRELWRGSRFRQCPRWSHRSGFA